jgi:hypothetical protein
MAAPAITRYSSSIERSGRNAPFTAIQRLARLLESRQSTIKSVEEGHSAARVTFAPRPATKPALSEIQRDQIFQKLPACDR